MRRTFRHLLGRGRAETRSVTPKCQVRGACCSLPQQVAPLCTLVKASAAHRPSLSARCALCVRLSTGTRRRAALTRVIAGCCPSTSDTPRADALGKVARPQLPLEGGPGWPSLGVPRTRFARGAPRRRARAGGASLRAAASRSSAAARPSAAAAHRALSDRRQARLRVTVAPSSTLPHSARSSIDFRPAHRPQPQPPSLLRITTEQARRNAGRVTLSLRRRRPHCQLPYAGGHGAAEDQGRE